MNASWEHAKKSLLHFVPIASIHAQLVKTMFPNVAHVQATWFYKETSVYSAKKELICWMENAKFVILIVIVVKKKQLDVQNAQR